MLESKTDIAAEEEGIRFRAVKRNGAIQLVIYRDELQPEILAMVTVAPYRWRRVVAALSEMT